MTATARKKKLRTYYATVTVTRTEQWCVEAESAEDARALLAAGDGHRCHPGECLAIEVEPALGGAELAAAPRLAQFPSPRQLSEQERLLKDFVKNSPEEAVQVAQDQEERQHELETLIAASDSESAQQEK